ncbi:ABC transporter ATP-binding protein [Arenibaculum sp.]|uniref:ABC transporter ATP-binding protein n=1 Tax=Arenibaculum sp. TaxID=2865862 RepID=UPI002E0F83F9|nr:ABC transporter ATP-binding protein [Arenibaculum sp.]
MSEAILSTSGLSRSFGGLTAVDGLSIEFHMRRIHAVIGPNGAGKSTFINLLSGDLPPSAGTIRFDGRDVTGLSADRVSQLGIGRSYQKTNIFPDFTAFENCRLAAQSRLTSSMRFFRPALRLSRVNDAARAALDAVGLDGRAEVVASALSHGEQRQLEIAMVLATGPKVLLLDEPLAGMGAEESARMVALLERLAREHAIVLVEHDMDAVFQLADRLTVMVNGRLLESGTPEEIRSSPAVQDAYLGTGEHD